jgi:hypothetical protein
MLRRASFSAILACACEKGRKGSRPEMSRLLLGWPCSLPSHFRLCRCVRGPIEHRLLCLGCPGSLGLPLSVGQFWR